MKNLWILSLVLLTLFIARLDRYFFKLNGSFCPNFIHARWSRCPQFKTQKKNIQAYFNQPFTYLTKGKQTFVFVSQDQKYVLKFPRMPSYLRPYSFKRRPPSPFFQQSLVSFKGAYEDLAKETGVLYAHLMPTDFLRQKVDIIDKFGVKYRFDLDQLPFVLQKKAIPFFFIFDHLKGEKAKTLIAKTLIAKTIALFVSLYEKGYIDRDPILDKNFGLYEMQPMIIDIGQLEKCTSLPSKRKYVLEMTQSLGHKLQHELPKLYAYYLNLIDTL